MSYTTTVGDGKYTVTNDNGRLTCLRHGEVWEAGDRELCGDGLSLALVFRIEEDGESLKAKDAEILALKEQVASLQRVLAHRRDSDLEVVG
jgi:hypothetical protein